VPYNADPAMVQPLPGVRAALDAVRAHHLPVAVVTNQSGVASGRISLTQLHAVHERLVDLLGWFDVIVACPHGPDDGCGCRKPAPGLVTLAAELLGVDPAQCALVGDTMSDVCAALAAGAWPILVPNEATRPEEVASAPIVAPSFDAAVRLVLDSA
jgi:D-glycero-D-manno-heptose 1,7-bisphosphate phosphatase